jgi:hypothetical protein
VKNGKHTDSCCEVSVESYCFVSTFLVRVFCCLSPVWNRAPPGKVYCGEERDVDGMTNEVPRPAYCNSKLNRSLERASGIFLYLTTLSIARIIQHRMTWRLMTKHEMMLKETILPNLRRYCGICLETARKITRHCKNYRSPGWYLNPGHPTYVARQLWFDGDNQSVWNKEPTRKRMPGQQDAGRSGQGLQDWDSDDGPPSQASETTFTTQRNIQQTWTYIAFNF